MEVRPRPAQQPVARDGGTAEIEIKKAPVAPPQPEPESRSQKPLSKLRPSRNLSQRPSPPLLSRLRHRLSLNRNRCLRLLPRRLRR